MTFDYATLRDSVVEPQITAFGQSATLRQPGTPTGDEWNPTPGTPTEYTVDVLKTRFTQAERAGTLVQEGDVVFLMSTLNDPAPTLNGTLTVGSITYQIIDLTPISPGSITVLWRVHCRK